jgi:hypothetical protein
MANQSTKKPDPEAEGQVPEPEAVAVIEDAKPFVGEYLDEIARTYQFDGAPPQTAERGDVCALPHDPGDGRWQPSTRKVTRLPDNHPDQFEITSARQAKARLKAHEDAAKAAEGGERR